MRMPRQAKGFTLIELVIVIIALGVLAATALPKFIHMQDDATEAVIEGQFAAFSAAVGMYHSGWLVKGHTGAINNLEGFGDGDVDSSATGYPFSTTDNTVRPFNGCGEIWSGLTDTSLVSEYVSDADLPTTTADIAYTYTTSTCVYRGAKFIQQGEPTQVLTYDFNTGESTISHGFYPI